MQSSWLRRSLPIIGCHGRGSTSPGATVSTVRVTWGVAPAAGSDAVVTASPISPQAVTVGTDATA